MEILTLREQLVAAENLNHTCPIDDFAQWWWRYVVSDEKRHKLMDDTSTHYASGYMTVACTDKELDVFWARYIMEKSDEHD